MDSLDEVADDRPFDVPGADASAWRVRGRAEELADEILSDLRLG